MQNKMTVEQSIEGANHIIRGFRQGHHDLTEFDIECLKTLISHSQKQEKYRANFLWGKEGNLEVLMYEFANAGTEEYQKEIFNQITSLCKTQKQECVGVEEIEKTLKTALYKFQITQKRVIGRLQGEDNVKNQAWNEGYNYFAKELKETNIKFLVEAIASLGITKKPSEQLF